MLGILLAISLSEIIWLLNCVILAIRLPRNLQLTLKNSAVTSQRSYMLVAVSQMLECQQFVLTEMLRIPLYVPVIQVLIA